MTVLIYVNTSKQAFDAEHIKAFANADAAQAWFAENDPGGVAFEYQVLDWKTAPVCSAWPKVKWQEQAELYKAQAENPPHGLECESLLRSARQIETASHMNDRLTSPGLKAPA